jgi:NAD(P)-dependent dehydrogenase (short-subunit alcohol dehydrogenase family)
VRSLAAQAMGEGFDEILVSERVSRVASPEKIAAAAVYLTSDDAEYTHATALHIDGGRVGL